LGKIDSANDNLNGSEKIGLSGSGQQRFVDIHCHCLPAVDDGPATVADALALCHGLVNDCITSVIATPHQLGRFSDCNEAATVREAVYIFNEELKRNNIALTVWPGGDVRVDERICQLLEADKILTLADGGKYILLELPRQVFIDITPLLDELSSLGVQAIISHPERHPVLVKQPHILTDWLAHSAHLQITSASLLGGFGPTAQKAAWHFLSSGWATLVATDSHNMDSRKPTMKAAFEQISSKLGRSIAQLVCFENPSRVVNAQDIVPVGSVRTWKSIDETVPTNF